jgi:hypothetical protein
VPRWDGHSDACFDTAYTLSMAKTHVAFQMPSGSKITGRSSSITNAFVNAIIPVIPPSKEEVEEALSILGINPDDPRCAYCGDVPTEWDHLRPLVVNKKPTGYVSEIANLVPACGKCNQSKGKRHWREWMLSTARRSPTTRKLEGMIERIAALERYEEWRLPVRINFAEAVGSELWDEHWRYWSALIDLMKASQKHAELLRAKVADHVRSVR